MGYEPKWFTCANPQCAENGDIIKTTAPIEFPVCRTCGTLLTRVVGVRFELTKKLKKRNP